MNDIDQGDGYASPEENFWDDRTTPHYSSAHSAQRVAPDREAVAEIIWRSDSGPIPEPDSWSKLTQGPRDEYLLNADALIASGVLGVSADLIRAEALAEAADIARRNLREHRYPPEYGRVEEIAIALQERAAEYRKAADHG